MIEILNRETGAVVLAVEGERRNRYAFLDGIDLRAKCLTDADLEFARMRCANLVGADLSEAYLLSADLTEADLSGARLRRADCFSIKFKRANLTDADLSYATLQSADWRGAVLTGANLSRATMKGGRYDQYTIWPDDFVPKKHHLIYLPNTAKREAKRAAE